MTVKQIICIRRDLQMTKGKFVAQGAHASMKFIVDRMQANGFSKENTGFAMFSSDELEWMNGKFTKIGVSVDSEAELLSLIEQAKISGIIVSPIIDSGKTMFHGIPTLTCAAFGPAPEEKLFPITGKLKLM